MRVSVASTAGAGGAGADGFARSRSARYSSTGRTTQPSAGVGVCAVKLAAAHAVQTTMAIDEKRARSIEGPLERGSLWRRSGRAVKTSGSCKWLTTQTARIHSAIRAITFLRGLPIQLAEPSDCGLRIADCGLRIDWG